MQQLMYQAADLVVLCTRQLVRYFGVFCRPHDIVHSTHTADSVDSTGEVSIGKGSSTGFQWPHWFTEYNTTDREVFYMDSGPCFIIKQTPT